MYSWNEGSARGEADKTLTEIFSSPAGRSLRLLKDKASSRLHFVPAGGREDAHILLSGSASLRAGMMWKWRSNLAVRRVDDSVTENLQPSLSNLLRRVTKNVCIPEWNEGSECGQVDRTVTENLQPPHVQILHLLPVGSGTHMVLSASQCP